MPADLGVGLKIMGGVKCDRCNNLHAVITSIFTSSENLHADLKEGNVLSMLCPLMVLHSFRCKTTSSSVVNNGVDRKPAHGQKVPSKQVKPLDYTVGGEGDDQV